MLPQPQKGNQVGFTLLGSAPVIGSTSNHDMINEVIYGNPDGTTTGFSDGKYPLLADYSSQNPKPGSLEAGALDPGVRTPRDVAPINLVVDLSNATAGNVNDLRASVALQQVLELDARAGTRYNEKLQAFFGVSPDDYTLGRAEYLAGSHIVVEQGQVAQTSGTDSNSPQGNIAAYSLTGGDSQKVSKGFKEHGFVIGVAMVRTHQTYQQGLNKMFTRKVYTDFYNPLLANLGEQPVLRQEIFFTDDMNDNNLVLGYQEA